MDANTSGETEESPEKTGDNDTSEPSETEIQLNSVYAGETAVDIELYNASSVKLSAEDGIFSDDEGVSIALSEAGGTAKITAPIIEAENQGLSISAAPGTTISIENTDYISALDRIHQRQGHRGNIGYHGSKLWDPGLDLCTGGL